MPSQNGGRGALGITRSNRAPLLSIVSDRGRIDSSRSCRVVVRAAQSFLPFSLWLA